MLTWSVLGAAQRHRILVTLGKAKYSQPFALRPEETMYITVELAPQE